MSPKTYTCQYTCPYLQRQRTVYLDQVVDESRPLPLSLQETANIEAYAQKNVISFFLFKNNVHCNNECKYCNKPHVSYTNI